MRHSTSLSTAGALCCNDGLCLFARLQLPLQHLFTQATLTPCHRRRDEVVKAMVVPTFFRRLKDLQETLKEKRGYNFYSTSVLLVYDADRANGSLASVRLIDFAHTQAPAIQAKEGDSPDEGILKGMENLVRMFGDVLDSLDSNAASAASTHEEPLQRKASMALSEHSAGAGAGSAAGSEGLTPRGGATVPHTPASAPSLGPSSRDCEGGDLSPYL